MPLKQQAMPPVARHYLVSYYCQSLFFAIFYFLVIRPQSKRTKEHRAMVNSLTVGSEVIFAGGLMGRIKQIEGDYAVVSLNNNTDVKVQRASVISVLPAGTIESV